MWVIHYNSSREGDAQFWKLQKYEQKMKYENKLGKITSLQILKIST